MEPLTKKELERVRKVNAMKEIAKKSERYKLSYFPGGNLMLLKKIGSEWYIKEQTGKWFEETEKVLLH